MAETGSESKTGGQGSGQDREHPEDVPLPGMPSDPPKGKVFSAAEAAKACGVGRATIQRALADGRLDGAERTDQGWQIPLTALLGAGFRPGTPTKETEHATGQGGDQVTGQGAREPDRTPDRGVPDPALAELRDEVTRLSGQLQELQARAAIAEAIADERGAHLDDMRRSLRILEASTQRPEPAEPAPPAPTPDAPENEAGPSEIAYPADDGTRKPRRNWWQRLTRG